MRANSIKTIGIVMILCSLNGFGQDTLPPKDKYNKPTVNFEVVWREINSSHVAGISAVYSFGKFLK